MNLFNQLNQLVVISLIILYTMSVHRDGEKSRSCAFAQRMMMIQLAPGTMMRLNSNRRSTTRRRNQRQNRMTMMIMQPGNVLQF